MLDGWKATGAVKASSSYDKNVFETALSIFELFNVSIQINIQTLDGLVGMQIM